MKLPRAASNLLAIIHGLGDGGKGSDQLPVQTGALPWRIGRGKHPEVLLVTGRNSGRWTVPKGWPMQGKSLAKAAAQEAFEEAGVKGTIGAEPLGSFRHLKQHMVFRPFEVKVVVYSLSVRRELGKWPEAGQRERRWFALDEAAAAVDSPELGQLILGLAAKIPASKAK